MLLSPLVEMEHSRERSLLGAAGPWAMAYSAGTWTVGRPPPESDEDLWWGLGRSFTVGKKGRCSWAAEGTSEMT